MVKVIGKTQQRWKSTQISVLLASGNRMPRPTAFVQVGPAVLGPLIQKPLMGRRTPHGVDAGDAVQGDVDGGHEHLVDAVHGEEAAQKEIEPPLEGPRELCDAGDELAQPSHTILRPSKAAMVPEGQGWHAGEKKLKRPQPTSPLQTRLASEIDATGDLPRMPAHLDAFADVLGRRFLRFHFLFHLNARGCRNSGISVGPKGCLNWGVAAIWGRSGPKGC